MYMWKNILVFFFKQSWQHRPSGLHVFSFRYTRSRSEMIYLSQRPEVAKRAGSNVITLVSSFANRGHYSMMDFVSSSLFLSLSLWSL